MPVASPLLSRGKGISTTTDSAGLQVDLTENSFFFLTGLLPFAMLS